MMPFFSIITPTIQRESLKECCASVDIQTYPDWEHIVMIDAAKVNESMITRATDQTGDLLSAFIRTITTGTLAAITHGL